MSKQTPEVRPCPHCGSPARSIREFCDGTWTWVVVCDGCDAEGPPGTTEAMAVKRWNKREADKLADTRVGEAGLLRATQQRGRECIGLGLLSDLGLDGHDLAHVLDEPGVDFRGLGQILDAPALSEGGEEIGTGEGPAEGMPAGEEMAGAPEEAGPPAGEAAGGDAASLVAAGMRAKHAGDLNAAQQNFAAAVAADPNNVDAHWGLAWVYAQKKMKEKAITEFNKVKALGADEEKVAGADEAIARLSK